MAMTRVGLDRIIKQETTAIAVWAETNLETHAKHCAQCSLAGTDPYEKCSTWWEYARLAHTARRLLRAYEQPVAWNQPTLPGMENLDGKS